MPYRRGDGAPWCVALTTTHVRRPWHCHVWYEVATRVRADLVTHYANRTWTVPGLEQQLAGVCDSYRPQGSRTRMGKLAVWSCWNLLTVIPELSNAYDWGNRHSGIYKISTPELYNANY